MQGAVRAPTGCPIGIFEPPNPPYRGFARAIDSRRFLYSKKIGFTHRAIPNFLTMGVPQGQGAKIRDRR